MTMGERRKLNCRTDRESSYRHASSVEELTKRNVETILRLEEATKGKRDRFERAADAITNLSGSMRFVVFHVIWFGLWIIWNTALPVRWRLDPFPFSFLTLVVSLEAIFLSTFILISQKRETALNERRAQLDLQVNLLSEQENTKMLEMLEKIGKRLGVDMHNDPEVAALEEATRPQELLEQIDKTMRKPNKG